MTIRSYKQMALVFSIAMTSLFAMAPTASFGQEMSTGARPPVIVDLSQPSDSPLRLTRAPSLSSDRFSVRAENVGQAPILAFVIVAREVNGSAGNMLTTVLDNWLLPGSSQMVSIPIDQIDNTAAYTVDLVRLAGGSTWGPDNAHMSDLLDGQTAGRQASIERLKELVSFHDGDTLSRILNTDPSQIEVTADTSRSDKWRHGYVTGYRSVISWLAGYRDQGEEVVLAKLASLQ